MRAMYAKATYCVIALTLLSSVLASSCSTSTVPPPTIQVKPTLTATVIPPTETLVPSATPDLRPRLITSDKGTILRPEVEINDKNFRQVKLLGTLGSGTPVAVQFSPDDSLLAVATSIGDVYIHDARTLELINTIQTDLPFQFPTYFTAYGMCDPCGKFVISPDNKLLGVLSIDGNLQIWNLESQQQIASSTQTKMAWITQQRLAGVGVRAGGSTIRFSDDNQYLGIFGETIWWPPGACLYAVLEQCERNFERPYFVLSASDSAWSVPLWCVEVLCTTPSSLQIQDDLSQFYDAFTFSHENATLPPIPLPKTMNEKTQYQGKSYLNPKQQYISPDGNRALSYDEYGVVNNFPRYGHSEVMYAGTLWDVPNNKVINTFSFPYVDVYAFSHNLGTIAYMDPMGVTVLDIQGTNRGEIPYSTCLGKLTFSPDGSILAGYFRNVIYFCDPLTARVIHTISVPTGFISSIAFSHDGKFVGSTGQTWGNYLSTSKENYDAFAYIWNVTDGELVATLPTQGDTMVIKFSPDGKYIATGAGIYNAGPAVATPRDKRFILWSWDGRSANKLKEQEFDLGVGNLVFSPNSQEILLATTGAPYYREQPRIYLYDIAHDSMFKSYYQATGYNDPPDLLQFLPSGGQFFVGDRGQVQKVSISTGGNNPEFLATGNYSGLPYWEYNQLDASPDLSLIVLYASIKPDDNHIRMGDIAYTKSIELQSDHDLMSVTFSPDGKVIYGGANILGVIPIWGIPTLE